MPDLPQSTTDHLEKCRMAAIAAVESYNRPGPRFRAYLYVVLIVIAWQGFFHAWFYRSSKKPWYRSKNPKHTSGVHYEMVDGEPRHWGLSKCLKEYFRDKNPPEKKNLEFLIGLRNKIAHCNLPQFDPTLYGEFQAALMNLENYLVGEFGSEYGLEASLAVALQFSHVRPPAQIEAIRNLAGTAKSVMSYIDSFRGGLSPDIANHPGYAYRVFLVPKIVNQEKSADAAIEFVHFDSNDPVQQAKLQRMNAIIKDRHVSIVNLNLKKPSQVVKEVSALLPFDFNMHHHTVAWKHFKVRPAYRAAQPECTDSSYCLYDKPNNQYLYTESWVKKLVSEFQDPSNFEKVTGKPPQPKSDLPP